MHPAMQLLPGGAKLILCTTKPEAENPVRTNESQTSNNFLSNWKIRVLKQESGKHIYDIA